ITALPNGTTPTIFDTDQGSQFTAQPFTVLLETAGVQISMDGRGRVFDNIFVERLWRTVKYEFLMTGPLTTADENDGPWWDTPRGRGTGPRSMLAGAASPLRV